MQTILLIEDQIETATLVASLLGRRHRLLHAASGEAGVRVATEESTKARIDLILLDVTLPDADGFELFTRLRDVDRLRDVPIIFLTGRAQVNDRVAAFALGAEDYVVKPFEPLEFRARVEAKLFARRARESEEETLRKGRLVLERAKVRASSVDEDGRTRDLGLTPHEFRLLCCFVTHEGHVLARDRLMDVVWGTAVNVLERTIDRHVSALRRKLDPRFETVESVHGVGYRFSFRSSRTPRKGRSAA